MKKIIVILAAVLLSLTACRNNNTSTEDNISSSRDKSISNMVSAQINYYLTIDLTEKQFTDSLDKALKAYDNYSIRPEETKEGMRKAALNDFHNKTKK